MEEMQGFLQWFADHEPARFDRLVADMETTRLGLCSQTVEQGIAGRDAAWRLYGLALAYGFRDAAAYCYEVYELVCRSLAYALEGTW